MSITLPIEMTDRRYDLGEHCGECFAEGEDYDGLILSIEIKSEAEARAGLAAIESAEATA